MTWGNRLFWGIIFFFGFHLVWLGVLEKFLGPVWIATIIGAFFVFFMLKYGPRPKLEEEGKGA